MTNPEETTDLDAPWSAPLHLRALSRTRPTPFDLRPEGMVLDALARHLGLLKLRKLSLVGQIEPLKNGDWHLKARLGATVDQPCVVTLAPVRSRIEEPVERLFTRDQPEYEAGSEVEMPEDDTSEPLGDTIDPGLVMAEALALALPLFPRAPGAELADGAYSHGSDDDLTQDSERPFAGLKSLRDRLAGDDGGNDR